MSKGKMFRIRPIPTAIWRTLNGGHRPTDPANQRSPDPEPGDAGRDDPAAIITYRGIPIRTVADLANLPDPPAGGILTTISVFMHTNSARYSDSPDLRPALKREMQLGEVIGYRCWRLNYNHLRSVFMHDIWMPGAVMVSRSFEDWGVRGVHAWKDAGSFEFAEYIQGYLPIPSLNDPTIITGTVLLWGDVVEHQYGYRAEFAKVRSIDWVYPAIKDMGNEQRILSDLRCLYHV